MQTAEKIIASAPGQQEIEQFLFLEARLLDEKKFHAWTDLFTEDGTYWIPTSETQKDPYSYASIMFDDKATMAMRIRRLLHPQNHAQAPSSRTVHLVTNVSPELDMAGDDSFFVDACFLMVEFRGEDQTTYGGRYRYRLVCGNDGLRIESKTVHMVNCDGAHQIMSIYI